MNRILFSCLIVVALALPVIAAEKTESPAAATMPAVTEVKTATTTATVANIDYDTRKVTLKGAQGDNVIEIDVSAEVRNLKQIKAGDKVKIEYVETVVVAARKGDGSKPSDKMSTEKFKVVRPGAKPIMVQVKVEEIVTVVTAINAEKRVINLKLPGGGIQTYFVPRKYQHLDNVKKGDQIVVRLSQSICTKLTKVGKAAKPQLKQPEPVPTEK